MSRMMIAVVRCGHLSHGRGLLLLIPRQHCIHPGDESRELLHVLPEKLFGGLVGHAPIVGDQASFELHVRLDGIHQGGIAESENAAQMLLSDGRADLAR